MGAADRRPGSLSKQTELVKKPLFDEKNVGALKNFVFVDAGYCCVSYLDEGNDFANAEPDIVHLGLAVGDELGQNPAPQKFDREFGDSVAHRPRYPCSVASSVDVSGLDLVAWKLVGESYSFHRGQDV